MTEKTEEYRNLPHPSDQGFTLMEMMVVIMIIGLLAGLVVPNLLSSKTKADQKKVVADIVAIENALTLYRIDKGELPAPDEGLNNLVAKPGDYRHSNDSYLRNLPDDPWHHPYHYAIPGQHNEYDVYSLGADNKPGGKEADRDIGNWNVDQF